MASQQDSLQLLLSCIVCLEEFEQNGDHIPRLLPCTHTVCENCIKQLIRDNKLECPECRAKHEAKNKEKSFPQNKYLLTQITRKPAEQKPERREKDLCEEHDKELVLFCRDTGCQCLTKYHRKHDVVNTEDETRRVEEVLRKKITYFEQNLLKAKIDFLTAIKTDVNVGTNVCLKDLEKRREEIKNELDKQFNKMKKEAVDQKNESNSSLDNEIAVLKENLNLLNSIKLDTPNSTTATTN